ncbi:MAG: hypothetical protein FWG26_00215 [Betaproteobacteria bacterium]|nr:hypothetical protein [Betaproteobacteria bacterium]
MRNEIHSLKTRLNKIETSMTRGTMDEAYRVLLDDPKSRSLKGERDVGVLIDEGNDILNTALEQGVDIGLTQEDRLAFRGADGTGVKSWPSGRRITWERLVSSNRVALRCALEESGKPRFDAPVRKQGAMDDDQDGNKWITMNGAHILVDKDGFVRAGVGLKVKLQGTRVVGSPEGKAKESVAEGEGKGEKAKGDPGKGGAGRSGKGKNPLKGLFSSKAKGSKAPIAAPSKGGSAGKSGGKLMLNKTAQAQEGGDDTNFEELFAKLEELGKQPQKKGAT